MPLTADQRTTLRQLIAANLATQTWTKPQVNAALDALDDWFETSGRAAAGAAIEAAVPGVFTGPQKRVIGKYWLATRSGLE